MKHLEPSFIKGEITLLRIAEITVEGLFGIYQHRIPLNLEERLTIIHGPNGVGKTALLRLTEALFSARYYEFYSIPFRSFQVKLDSSENRAQQITVTQDGQMTLFGDTEISGREFVIRYESNGILEGSARLSPKFSVADLPLGLRTIEREIPSLERIDPRRWRHYPTGEIFSLSEVLQRFAQDLVPTMQSADLYETADWLADIQNRLQVRLIEAQRLLSLPQLRRADGVTDLGRDQRTRTGLTSSVEAYSLELRTRIGERLEESGAISQPLDRSFPMRVVREVLRESLSISELQDALSQLEEKRKNLIRLGLLDEEPFAPVLQVPTEIDDTMRKVLSVYVSDTNEKLSVYDDISRRIETFLKLVNERFIHKEMRVERDRGFFFINNRGEELPITGLSSGEQHQVVLLYELLFKTKPGSLIMIDEPELSLHVAWQERFLRDMKEIAVLNQFDSLIATHSPQIIGNRWDLTVELKWRQ